MNTHIEIADLSTFSVLSYRIGSRRNIAGWPTSDLAGLIQALQQWTIDPWMNFHGRDPDHPHARYSAPFRTLAWGCCIEEPIPGLVRDTRYVGTKPIHEGNPEAVRFSGNFLNWSFGFTLDTDDPSLIELLDNLIADNMSSPDYVAATTRMKRLA